MYKRPSWLRRHEPLVVWTGVLICAGLLLVQVYIMRQVHNDLEMMRSIDKINKLQQSVPKVYL